ncbi:hypothetical protein [Halomicrobium urmianum]|uniref:hypothetical protein n=1 Tax=Halomicrobium urmianum TaxID=1586233 RepID=UPI001CD97DFD|nr:hypothetical protein [Halomicrobium urmianum]
MVTLDDRDTATLWRLRRGDADVGTLAETVRCDPSPLQDRLAELADNGLVAAVDGGYRITSDGERVLAASGTGADDDRIDTSPDVEQRIESFALRADREAAVRSAFAVLHYWGDATRGEIIDAVYSEDPAGYETRDEWWGEGVRANEASAGSEDDQRESSGVREYLADLPTVDPPDSPDAPGATWRYEGTPTVAELTDDGRVLLERAVTPFSARFAVERLDLSDDERAAVRAAVDWLVREGESDAEGIADAVFGNYPAGHDSPEKWWASCVEPAFEAIPGVQRADSEEERWRYRQRSIGRTSTDPGAGLPDESLASDEDP